MELHLKGCKTCGEMFQTYAGFYCDKCRKIRLSEMNKKRKGIKHKTSHGGSHKPKPMAEATCPRCRKTHMTEVLRPPKKKIWEYCGKPCRQLVDFYSSGMFAEHRIAL